MKRRNAILLLSMLLIFCTCSKNGTGPPAHKTEYLLYAVDGCPFAGSAVFVIDPKNDSIIDSIIPPFSYIWNFDVTSDGKYFALNGGDPPTIVYDARTRTEVARIDGGGHIAFADDIGMLLSFRLDTLRYYRLSDFRLDDVDSVSKVYFDPYPRLLTEKGLAYGYDWPCEVDDEPCPVPFVEYDYRHKRIVREWYTGPGSLSQAFDIDISDDGRLLFIKAHMPPWQGMASCFDLVDSQLVWYQPGYWPVGRVELNPDETELWHTDPGWPSEGILNRGYIWIYEPTTGALFDSVSLFGHGDSLNPNIPGLAFDIEFVPNMDKAYVAGTNCGISYDWCPVYVIDTKKREVTKELFRGTTREPELLRVAPKP